MAQDILAMTRPVAMASAIFDQGVESALCRYDDSHSPNDQTDRHRSICQLEPFRNPG